MSRFRFKHFLRERNEYSATGEETLLSVSEYYGVKPRSNAFEGDAGESRAASLEGYRIVKPGDLVMNYMLAWKGAYGLSDFDGITSPAYAVFDVDADKVDRRFLHHRTRSQEMQVEFKARSKGIIESRLRLYPDALLAMEVELPDLPTQKRIAAFLDRETERVDELIAKKERLVEVLNATRAATPLRVMAGGMGVIQYDPTNNRVDFSSLTDGWKRVRVKHVAKHMTSGSRGWGDFIQDDGELFLQSGSIDRKMGIAFEDSHRVAPQSGAEADRTTVHNGDTLVCITGGRTGAVGFMSGLNERAYINQHVCLIRPSKAIEERLLAQILFSEVGQLHFQMAQYGLKQGMGFEQVANVAIPLPPRDQQESITAAIDAQASKTTKAASQIMASVGRLREYRAALITAAVTGQIDVETYGKASTTSETLDRIEEEMQA